jgi:hypothetical protein
VVGARGMGRIGGEVQQLAARAVLQFIAAALPGIEKQAEGGE